MKPTYNLIFKLIFLGVLYFLDLLIQTYSRKCIEQYMFEGPVFGVAVSLYNATNKG